MSYTLMRFEKNRDKSGTVVSIFVSILVEAFGSSLIQEQWLDTTDMGAVLADETALFPILITMTALGMIELERLQDSRPQPPVIAATATLAELSTHIVDTLVTAKIAELKAKG